MINLNIPVSAIMRTNPATVTPQQKLVDVKHIFEAGEFHHHIPVTTDGKIVGMVSLIDFMRTVKHASLIDNDPVYQEQRVENIMSIHPVTKSSDTSIKEIATEFSKGEIHAIAITENNLLKGIVSTTDIIRYFLSQATH